MSDRLKAKDNQTHPFAWKVSYEPAWEGDTWPWHIRSSLRGEHRLLWSTEQEAIDAAKAQNEIERWWELHPDPENEEFF